MAILSHQASSILLQAEPYPDHSFRGTMVSSKMPTNHTYIEQLRIRAANPRSTGRQTRFALVAR